MQNFASQTSKKTAAMRLVEIERGIDLEEFLTRRYHADGVRLADIAAELTQDVSTISRWMDRLGIDRRVRTMPPKTAVVA